MGKIARSIHCKFLSFAFIFLTVAKYMNYNKGSAFAILYSPKLIPNSRIAELNTSLKKGIYSICSSNLPLNIRNWSQDSLSYIGLYEAWIPTWFTGLTILLSPCLMFNFMKIPNFHSNYDIFMNLFADK